ncbi:uncharacterized protein LOC141911001 [Tubulanus polymorphus]|uniref:uncharacterized protein LOC141911001 n=1 Tax=Tubulanus polymorphus TaxID=672921 RepID=UPI003DA5DBB8
MALADIGLTDQDWSLINKGELMMTKKKKEKGTTMTAERKLFRDLVKVVCNIEQNLMKATKMIQEELNKMGTHMSLNTINKEIKSYKKNRRDTEARKKKQQQSTEKTFDITCPEDNVIGQCVLKKQKEDGNYLVVIKCMTNLGKLIRPKWKKGVTVIVTNNFKLLLN